MEKESSEIMKQILNFTLEIIYLLTGEDYITVKKISSDCVTPGSHPSVSGECSRIQSATMDAPSHSLIPGRNHEQKILDLTKKITELLTGEVPIRCQDVTVHFSMEEWEYLEGHKDLYKDVMVQDHQPVTSLNMDGSSWINPPERCPSPLHSWDWSEKDDTVPQDYQGEVLTNIKLEVKSDDETHDDQRCKEEEIPVDVSTDNPNTRLGEIFLVTQNYEEEDIMQHSSAENLITFNVYPGLHSTDRPFNPAYNIEPSSNQLQIVTTSTDHRGGKMFQCGECGKQFTKNANLFIHRRTHTGEKPFSCSECGKSFHRKFFLSRHKIIHTGEKRFQCSECGKRFITKDSLKDHLRIHTGEKPYSCSQCGRCFTQRSSLAEHKRTHTGETTLVQNVENVFTKNYFFLDTK
ncbi:oocyte zinc finger protein XlCOF8.4-like [Bufo gargarizans]|uniref:oocyte zinc finger protein XlCOF8.4-like n=1 Tax=Bufo gargarizans TaxID=30331 RepID=UPI001CF21FE3|nr:oocyte zinc finger protein XlCOF8.4-like [Bufo gargarizans]